MINMKASELEKSEAGPGFNWRGYISGSENLTQAIEEKLDILAELVNSTDGEEFRLNLNNGHYRGNVLLALVQYYRRSALTPEEVKELLEFKL